MRPRRSTPSCARIAPRPSGGETAAGFSLVEMLIALVIALFVVAAALSVAYAGRWVLDADLARTTLNQNLRSGIDLIGIDVKQAGERLPADVPALEIVDGAATAPETTSANAAVADRLIVRRNLVDQVLPLCAPITAGSTSSHVVVAKDSGTIPPGCTPVSDVNGDGWPDNMEAWRGHRQSQGGSVWAYLYNPSSRSGEFFLYYRENATGFALEKANTDAWQFDYAVTDQARVYILEQRTFRLEGDTLQCIVNGIEADPFNLVVGVRDFQVRGWFQDGSVQDAVGINDSWSELHSIEVLLRGRDEFHGEELDRELVTRFFPRNVLSR